MTTDYVLVVITHANTTAPRVVGLLFSDSFPCVGNIHNPQAAFASQQQNSNSNNDQNETLFLSNASLSAFRKQEALLIDHQSKLALLISHVEMFPSFDVMRLRDEVVAPYWDQLLISKGLKTPSMFNENTLASLSNAVGAGGPEHVYYYSAIQSRTNTAMSPGVILPPPVSNHNGVPLNQQQDVISNTTASVGSASVNAPPPPQPQQNNNNPVTSNGAFPSTPAGSAVANNINNAATLQQRGTATTPTNATSASPSTPAQSTPFTSCSPIAVLCC
jgi:hypothetical protein